MTSTKGASYSHCVFVTKGGGERHSSYRFLGSSNWGNITRRGLGHNVDYGGALTLGPSLPEFPTGYFALYLLVGGGERAFYAIPDSRIFTTLEGGGQVSDITSSPFELAIYPNLLTSKTTISFSLAKDEMLSLTLYDAMGRMVKNIFSGKLPSGNHSFS